MSRVQQLRAQGFDRSTVVPFRRQGIPKCSQCEVLVINGTACHETGCPNVVHECKGCNARVDRRGAYCEDCQ